MTILLFLNILRKYTIQYLTLQNRIYFEYIIIGDIHVQMATLSVQFRISPSSFEEQTDLDQKSDWIQKTIGETGDKLEDYSTRSSQCTQSRNILTVYTLYF